MPATPGLTQVEQDKLTIDPDIDFRDIATRPLADLSPNLVAMFKWSGVYQQLQPTFFMIRLVTPGGLISSVQLRRAADLAQAYAQGQLCITTRQTLQFHWVRREDIYKVLDGMADVGMTTRNGCGDVTRNVVTCSLQGVCPHEVGPHVRELIQAAATDPELRDRQRNLPRKHKISIAGCGRACAQTLMNCQGWVPATRLTDARVEHGWQFYAGGGLGARPYLAKRLFDWVPNDLALPVIKATAEAFNRHGDRRNRAFARLKIVVDRLGADGFAAVVLAILRERAVAGLDRIVAAADSTPAIEPAFLDGQETIPQRQAGLTTVRIMVRRSELTSDQTRRLADWADTFGSGHVMLTNRQNAEIRNVPTERVQQLLRTVHEAGFSTAGHERLPDVVACVGTTVCRLAAADTPAACHRIVAALADDTALWNTAGTLRLNLTGCPNNCAHAWVADIGLRGRRCRSPEGTGSFEAFDVFVGGSLSGAGRLAQALATVPAEDVADAIRRMLRYYVHSRRNPDVSFAQFVAQAGVEGLRLALCGGESGDAVQAKCGHS